jgi:Flp pilus assembly protein TadG
VNGRKRPRRDGRQLGIASVEFAIVLPFLLLLLFGVTELGRALIRYNALTKTVRDGARYAAAYALLGTTGQVQIDAQLQTATRNLIVYGNTAGTGTPVVAGLTPGEIALVDLGGDRIRVDANYPYQPMFGAMLPTFGNGPDVPTAFVMQVSITMRAL